MIFRVSHSISGCVEAPVQLVMNTFLVMKGILGIPWWKTTETKTATDAVGNEFTFYSIPLWTLIFSIIDILKCTVLTNIFNVYIGKISSWAIFKKYVNLIFGQLPFFLHAMLFRVLAYSFLIVYLNYSAIIPIFCIWLSNLIIGYGMASNKQAKKGLSKMKGKLTKMKSMVHIEAGMKRVETGTPKSNAMLQSSTPIWLNSFFSIMVPTCSVNIIDPYLVHSNEDNEQLQKQFYKFNKNYQETAMRKLLLATNFIILVSVGSVWGMVNFGTSFNYLTNIYGNLEFNIFCGVLFIMGIVSVVFMKSMDVYELLGLNNNESEARRENIEMTGEDGGQQRKPRKQKTSKVKVLVKILVTITSLVFVVG